MKHFKILFWFLVALSMSMPATFAQDATTQGKEFWLSFMGNGFKTNGYPNYVLTQVMVSSKRACSGTITNPNTNWSHSFEVAANNITLIDIPEAQAYNETSSYETPGNKGLMIVTTDTVTVYCTNIASNSFDASYILPFQALADEYIIQTYEQSTSYSAFGMSDISDYLTSAFLIVATEDNTTIDITPSTNTLAGSPAGEQITITLDKGQTYQVRSNHQEGGNRDLSGSRVSARDCKRIAVFNGNTLTTIPDVDNGYDHIFEQAMPLRSWGKQFIITQSFSRKRDFVKITSASDNNVIKQNGLFLATLNSCESYTFEIDREEKSCYIETSAPSGVYLYNTTSSDDGGTNTTGDPSMLWIAPVEQKMTDVTFTTFSGDEASNSSIAHHYVNIIVDSDATRNVYFDNALLPSTNFEPVAGNADFCFIRKEISHNVHHISCASGFNAQVYGFGRARGYAYLVGSKATDLSTVITVDDITVTPGDTVSNCDMTTLSFHAEVSYDNYELEWDLGDGSSSTQTSLTHTYEQEGLYQVTLTVVTQGDTPCQDSTFNTSVFYISTGKMPDQTYDETICFKGPDNYSEHGFNLHYESPGTFSDTYTIVNDNGCETAITLNLEVQPIIETEPVEESGQCDTFEWLGNTYTASGHYTDTLPDSTGCYSIHHLNLELHYSPNPTDIYPADTSNLAPHWVITATEFQIKAYEYKLWDHNRLCEWDTVIWGFENENLGWVLEPLGKSAKRCNVYVLEPVEDTVWLYAKVTNGCNPEGITKRYWLVSSFYGTEENNSVSTNFNIDIVPNPNRGDMDLITGPTTDPIEVKVYNMTGQLVDQFVLPPSTQARHPYQLSHHQSGIYCFSFRCLGKTITKKVVITK